MSGRTRETTPPASERADATGRADAAGAGSVERVRAAVAAVRDPELRVLTVEELGVLRDVRVEGGRAVVTITPTYLGCPALDAIRADIVAAATAAGCPEVEVEVTFTPPWTTDWLGETARAKLTAAGVAPPGRQPVVLALPALRVRCPRCGSGDTALLARSGSTACLALWRCGGCGQPFDHMRDH
ncbi:MAG TPA: 1,2-phenylacetyl-CoA epoxidase subunit PaaD [Nonomuraea sp.]|nr:1,2-phenylacetyl-CoA epoxidase subunit PaaD [Nonomuraea sp.]